MPRILDEVQIQARIQLFDDVHVLWDALCIDDKGDYTGSRNAALGPVSRSHFFTIEQDRNCKFSVLALEYLVDRFGKKDCSRK